MPIADTRHLEDLIGDARAKGTDAVALTDVVALAEAATATLQTFFSTLDSTLYRELRGIAAYIGEMRAEIGALQANELRESRIPAAGQELGAIVKATETATNTIMECAETVMAADASDPAAYKMLVDTQMLRVFEACSFQDITGQRIAKVVDTLQHIEQRIGRFVEAMRARDLEGFADEQERDRAERKSRYMLNGPAGEGEGIAQAQVDQIFT